MDALDAIKLRRSIRKYKDIRVEWEKIVLMLESGKSAPSAGNLQNYKFVVVTEKEKIKALSQACLKQNWIQTASVIIVIVGEHEKAARFYGVRGERLYTIQNCAAAAENMMIAATSMGLSTCWVSAFDEDEVKSILNIPDRARPQIVLTVGYADEVVPEPLHYPLETQVHMERYGCRILDQAAIDHNYSEIIQRNVQEVKESVKTTAEKVKEKIKGHIAKVVKILKKQE